MPEAFLDVPNEVGCVGELFSGIPSMCDLSDVAFAWTLRGGPFLVINQGVHTLGISILVVVAFVWLLNLTRPLLPKYLYFLSSSCSYPCASGADSVAAWRW